VVLTLGAANAYFTGAAAMTSTLTGPGRAGREDAEGTRPAPGFLVAAATVGLAVIGLYGAGLVSPAALVTMPTTLFLLVYLGCMASAVLVLRGPARWAAAPAAVIVAVVLAFCGWALLGPLAVTAAVGAWPWARRRLGRGRGALSR
jgi:amino acid efflux transporter